MIGQQLGSYRVVREIGRGGMGSVWLGEHLELGHKVAIKVLLPQIGREAESLQRFFNEARAAAKVRSPGIVQVLDFGHTADGAPYLAMELLDGETLRARMRAHGRLPIDEAATIIRQVATTLAAAHAGGIIHRDLKPDNVMLIADPEAPFGERAKILDFGIAKLTEDQWHASVQTRTGSLMGTPHYMSPEQCRGTGELDGRADVYALGCILFELLCGRPPFVSQGVGEIVGMHQFVPPPSPRSLREDLPEWLDAVILRALAKAPDDRFASMTELATALEGGGATAARARRGSAPATAGEEGEGVALAETVVTPVSRDTTAGATGRGRDTGVAALAETIANTPPRSSAPKVVAIAEAVAHGAGDLADVSAITEDARRRAQEMAEKLAREQAASAGGARKGQWMTVVAVAVVVMASVTLFVRFGDRAAERKAPGTADSDKGGNGDKSDKGDKGGKDDDKDDKKRQQGQDDGKAGDTVVEPRLPDTGSGTGGTSSDPHQQGSGVGVLDAGPPQHQPFAPPRDAGVSGGEAHFEALMTEARDALRDGDALAALRAAAAASELAPGNDAPLGLVVLAECQLDDQPAARKALARIAGEALRKLLASQCAKLGIKLRP